MMEFVNAIYEALGQPPASPTRLSRQPGRANLQPRALVGAVETLLKLLAPFAPHLAEELWERLGHATLIAHESWPTFDAAAMQTAAIELVVQVNGKVRARVTVPTGSSDEQARAIVLADAQVKKSLDGQPIKQVIVVPQRLINIVL